MREPTPAELVNRAAPSSKRPGESIQARLMQLWGSGVGRVVFLSPGRWQKEGAPLAHILPSGSACMVPRVFRALTPLETELF